MRQKSFKLKLSDLKTIRNQWIFMIMFLVARLWAAICRAPQPRYPHFPAPTTASTFLILYLLAVFIFALIYSIPNCSFLVGGVISKLSVPDSIYFSVVSITTLGFGDIVPRTSTLRLTVALEALIGIFLIGMFLIWVGHSLSHTQQKQLDTNERARLDRPLFPQYIALVHMLNKFLNGFDTEYGRPMNSHGWMVYEFGAERVNVAHTYFNSADYIRLHGGPSNLSTNTTANWGESIASLETNIIEALRDTDPTIDDIQLIKRFHYLVRLGETTRQDLQKIQADERDLENFVANRCEAIYELVEECESLRSYITSKADNSMDGVAARYSQFYRRTRHGPMQSTQSKPKSNGFEIGNAIGKRVRSLLNVRRDS